MNARTNYIAGLRQLADILENNPDTPLPYSAGTKDTPSQRITFYYLHEGNNAKGALADFARTFPGKLNKETRDETFSLAGNLAGGLYFEATAYRRNVCERVVTGTREVTKEVTDYTAAPVLAPTFPTVTVTETVEDVEWVCPDSILSEAS